MILQNLLPSIKLGCTIVLLLNLFACSQEDKAVVDKQDTNTPTVALSSEKKTQDREWVYIDDGAIQCEKQAQDLTHTRSVLLASGINVEDSKCATIVGAAVASLCGLKTLGIHIHLISSSDVKRARSQGFEPVSALAHYGDKHHEPRACAVKP